MTQTGPETPPSSAVTVAHVRRKGLKRTGVVSTVGTSGHLNYARRQALCIGQVS